MLINQEELQTLCLNRKATEELTAQVINQLNGITDPLVRYATARTLKAVFDKATEEAGAAAVDYCLTTATGTDSNHFEHEGLTFSLDYRCDFDYAANDTDENGEPAGYKTAKRNVDGYQKSLDAWKAKMKAAKQTIELAHPRMTPIEPKWTMKFYCKEL